MGSRVKGPSGSDEKREPVVDGVRVTARGLYGEVRNVNGIASYSDERKIWLQKPTMSQAAVLRIVEAHWVRLCSDAKLDRVVSHLWGRRRIDTGNKLNKALSLLTAFLVYALLTIRVEAVPGGYQPYKQGEHLIA